MKLRSHPSVTMAVILSIALAVAGIWSVLEHENLKGYRREARALNRSDSQAANQISESLKRFVSRSSQPSGSLQPGSALLDIIDGKIGKLGLSGAIREIQPQTPRNLSSLRIEEIRLRISPVPSFRLGELLDMFESNDPAIRISRYEIIRVAHESDDLDIILYLQKWFLTGAD